MEAYVCMKDVSSECLAETDEEALFDANHLYDRPFPLFFRSDIHICIPVPHLFVCNFLKYLKDTQASLQLTSFSTPLLTPSPSTGSRLLDWFPPNWMHNWSAWKRRAIDLGSWWLHLNSEVLDWLFFSLPDFWLIKKVCLSTFWVTAYSEIGSIST